MNQPSHLAVARSKYRAIESAAYVICNELTRGDTGTDNGCDSIWANVRIYKNPFCMDIPPTRAVKNSAVPTWRRRTTTDVPLMLWESPLALGSLAPYLP